MNAHDQAADLADRWSLRKHPRSWGGNCPVCDYHAAFSMSIGRKPGEADFLKLRCANGCNGSQLYDAAKAILGTAWTATKAPDPETVAQARAKKQAAAVKLWNGSVPCAGTAAERYLAGRGLQHLVQSPALRCRADCWHPEGGRHHALVALIHDAAGSPVAAHRTYLAASGSKAAVNPVKATLGPMWGGAIRLQDTAPELVVAEGIETAASAGLLLGLPAWAAVSAGNMAAGLVLPPEVRSVIVAADADAPGQRAARDAATRWRAEGRRVRLALPDTPGQDFNDVLMARSRETVHA